MSRRRDIFMGTAMEDTFRQNHGGLDDDPYLYEVQKKRSRWPDDTDERLRNPEPEVEKPLAMLVIGVFLMVAVALLALYFLTNG